MEAASVVMVFPLLVMAYGITMEAASMLQNAGADRYAEQAVFCKSAYRLVQDPAALTTVVVYEPFICLSLICSLHPESCTFLCLLFV